MNCVSYFTLLMNKFACNLLFKESDTSLKWRQKPDERCREQWHRCRRRRRLI